MTILNLCLFCSVVLQILFLLVSDQMEGFAWADMQLLQVFDGLEEAFGLIVAFLVFFHFPSLVIGLVTGHLELGGLLWYLVRESHGSLLLFAPLTTSQVISAMILQQPGFADIQKHA